VPTCKAAARRAPWSRQLWSQFGHHGRSGRRASPGRLPGPVVAVKHEWASSCESAPQRGTGHSRLTARHRCPTCTTVAGRSSWPACRGGRVSPGPLPVGWPLRAEPPGTVVLADGFSCRRCSSRAAARRARPAGQRMP
jgi:hypothetical protein